jgi:hypothetical protein
LVQDYIFKVFGSDLLILKKIFERWDIGSVREGNWALPKHKFRLEMTSVLTGRFGVSLCS